MNPPSSFNSCTIDPVAPGVALRPGAAQAVLDTNVVLDWLVFGNPDASRIGQAISDGSVAWLATPSMRSELSHVLSTGALDAWRPQTERLWDHWDRLCTSIPLPQTLPLQHPRCTDGDDQKFIDLALHARVRWLFSRDKAVLKLARRCRALGVEVLTPGAWSRREHPAP